MNRSNTLAHEGKQKKMYVSKKTSGSFRFRDYYGNLTIVSRKSNPDENIGAVLFLR